MRPRERGDTVVEALVALSLMAVAGGVVASAAATNLRATRTAVTIEWLTAAAAAAVAIAEARGAPAGIETTIAPEPGFGTPVERHVEVTRDDAGLATIDARVTVAGARPFHLTTRMPVLE